MRQVSFSRVTIKNFRGIQFLDVMLGNNVVVRGRNGIGKSTIKEAITWCLTGKDSEDRKDYNITPKDTQECKGNDIMNIIPEVELYVSVDDAEYTFKRMFDEKWTGERLTGHETKCFFCGKAVSVTEYTQKASTTMCSADTMKLLSNPLFFASLHWKIQRDYLFDLIGNIADDELADTDEKKALMVKYNGLTAAEAKEVASRNKTRMKKEQESVKTRIDQTYRLMPPTNDWEAIESQISACNAEIERMVAAKTDKAEACKAVGEERIRMQQQINELRAKSKEVYGKAVEEAQMSNRKAMAEKNALTYDLTTMKNRLQSINRELQEAYDNIDTYHRRIDEAEKHQEAKRNEYRALASKKWNGSTICMTCGQPLPEDKIAEARSLFSEQIRTQLAAISEDGKTIGKSIDRLKAAIEEAEKNVAVMETNKGLAVRAIGEMEEKLQSLHVEQQPIPAEMDIDECADLLTRADILAKSMPTDDAQNGHEYDAAIADLEQRRMVLTNDLAKREQIEKLNDEIASLREQLKTLANDIAETERDEELCASIMKARINLVESRINGWFDCVTFRLFRQSLNGNIEECCEPLVYGVPFACANSAGQIKAGLSIIKAMSVNLGVSMPIMIDNAESVLDIPGTLAQQILFRVTEDDELIID